MFNFDPDALRGLESGLTVLEFESPGPQTSTHGPALRDETLNCLAPLTSQAGCLELYAQKKKLA
jgi:hypothetical protein